MPGTQGIALAMLRAERLQKVQLFRQSLFEILRIERSATNSAPHEIHGDYFFPCAFEERSELNGMLWTDPPAVAASRAKADIVQEFSSVPLV